MVVDGLVEDAVPDEGGAAAGEVPAVAVEFPGRDHGGLVVDEGVGKGAVRGVVVVSDCTLCG